MYQIPVYRVERDAGLEQAIRANACVAYAAAARPAERGELSERAVARLRAMAPEFARAGEADFDLHHLTTILVTVGWNKNDDVFDGVETWVARRTPKHKQLNYEHDDAKIVGHITDNWVVDGDGKAVADETVADDLPAKFHVVTAGVLYKHWQTPELQERMDTLIAEIAEGKWFVSMECLFKGFDYALKAADGTTRVVARNERTAFLSKHLRAYGGTGKYGDFRVGRLLRNVVFSGKGMVKNPANPESVILSSDTENFSAKASEYVSDFSRVCAEEVYSLTTPVQTEDRTKESPQVMTVTLEQLQAQVAELTKENEKLKASQTDALVTDLKAKLDVVTAAKAELETQLTKATEAAKSAEGKGTEALKQVEAVQAKLTEAEAKLTEANDELKGLYAEKAKATRVTQVKAALEVDDAAAAEFVEANATLTDEQFTKQVEFVAKTVAGKVAKTAPKATDKPVGPKATDKPAPMAGKAGTETDDAGEQAAAATNLDAAQAKNDPALSTSVSDAGVTDMQTAIGALFGCTSDE